MPQNNLQVKQAVA